MEEMADDDVFPSHVHNGSHTHATIENYTEDREFKRFKKKVNKIFSKTGICKKCPDRYKALTQGKECCVYIEDD